MWSYQLIGQTNLGPKLIDRDALPGSRIRLPETGEFFTDLACTLVCRSVIAYLRTVWYGRRRPYRIKIHSCGALISKLTPT
jgi:hypothetical protein